MLNPSSSSDDSDTDTKIRPLVASLSVSSATVSKIRGGDGTGSGCFQDELDSGNLHGSPGGKRTGAVCSAASVGRGGGSFPGSCVDQRSLSALSCASGGSADNISLPEGKYHSSGGSLPRAVSPSLSFSSDRNSLIADGRDATLGDAGLNGLEHRGAIVGRGTEAEAERSLREEEQRRRHLQIYVFVMRCIAYSFNAKQPTDMVRRQTKMTTAQLQSIRDRFKAFLTGELNIPSDEAFQSVVQSYMTTFIKSDSIAAFVRSGGCSASDFRDVFKNNVEKRIRSLPEIQGLSKDTLLTAWMAKFDHIFRGDEDPRKWPQRLDPSFVSETVVSKEQLYDMFQSILGIKKYEHQILFNAMQLDSGDEQAAQVRREIDGRLHAIEDLARKRQPMPRFLLKEMESMYIEELRSAITLLKENLECQPVNKGSNDSKYSLNKFKKYNKSHTSQSGITKIDVSDDTDSFLTKNDVTLTFALEVLVMEVKGLTSLQPNKIVYCTMEVEGGEKLQTDQTDASKPCWDTQGDFNTNQPLPVVKVKLFTESSRMLSLEDRELGRVVLKPTATSPKTPEWYVLTPAKGVLDKNLQIKIAIRIDKPQNMKHCGYMYSQGKNIWKKWKKRYYVLVQVSQYTFAMCNYAERKQDPSNIQQLDGFTVDFLECPPEGVEGGKFFFNMVKEGDQVMFATEDEMERTLWVQAVYRATGQSHKPVPPLSQPNKANSQLTKVQGDAEKARKHGLDEFVQAIPNKFDHHELFTALQKLTLKHRLADQFTCLGWFSPGQLFVLDEYCSRYGVRGCRRHLAYLNDLLAHADHGTMIDPTLLHYSFAFSASHVHGNRPDGIATVMVEERDQFIDIKDKLHCLIEKQITNFRSSFPFGRPEGALKATLSLLERVVREVEYCESHALLQDLSVSCLMPVLMKDIVTPVSPEDVRKVINKCLGNAALANYTKICEIADIEESYSEDVEPKQKLDSLSHLAELCIELLQQNDEYHSDAFKQAFPWFTDAMVNYSETLWSLFAMDMDALLDAQPIDSWDSFPLFQTLNDYLRSHESLCSGIFHNHLRDAFAPQVVRYVDMMESSIAQSVNNGFEKEIWKPQGNGCSTSEDLLWKLDALMTFIQDLHWPDEVFAEHLEHRLNLLAAEMIEAAATRTLKAFEVWMKKGTRGTDYVFLPELLVMTNVIVDFKNSATKIANESEALDVIQNQMTKSLMERLLNVLESTLSKLARYDQSSLLSSVLTLAKPTDELSRTYVNFMRMNLDQIRQKIVDELYSIHFFETWYNAQMKMVSDWLSERLDINLHPYQLTCLISMTRKCYSDFELQGVSEQVLDSKTYQAVSSRLQVEESTQAIKSTAESTHRNSGGGLIGGLTSKLFGNGSAARSQDE